MYNLNGTTTGYGANTAKLANVDIRIGNSAVPINGIYSPGANQVAISTAGTGRLFVDASGRIGVGTTSATAYGMRLAVIENIGLVPATQDTITTSAVAIKTQLGSSGGEELIRSEITSFTNGANYGTATIFTTRNGASTTERMRIDSSGRLLVGTSSDAGGALLQVNGDRIRVGTAKTPASATATGTAGEICWDANYIYVCTAANTWKRTAIATW